MGQETHLLYPCGPTRVSDLSVPSVPPAVGTQDPGPGEPKVVDESRQVFNSVGVKGEVILKL